MTGVKVYVDLSKKNVVEYRGVIRGVGKGAGRRFRSKWVTDEHGRECTRCGVKKPWSEFPKCTAKKNGCNTWCRTCIADMKYKYARTDQCKANRLRYRQRKSVDPFFRLNRSIGGGIRKSLDGHKARRHWEDLVGYTLEKLIASLEAKFEPGMTLDNHGKLWHIDHLIPVSRFQFTTAEDPEFRVCWSLNNLVPRWITDDIAKAHGSNQRGNLNKGNKLIVEPQFVGLISANAAG